MKAYFWTGDQVMDRRGKEPEELAETWTGGAIRLWKEVPEGLMTNIDERSYWFRFFARLFEQGVPEAIILDHEKFGRPWHIRGSTHAETVALRMQHYGLEEYSTSQMRFLDAVAISEAARVLDLHFPIKDTMVLNYGMCNISDIEFHPGGFPFVSTNFGTVDSPICYLDNRIEYSVLSKHPRWNRMIMSLKWIAACRREVVPWIAPPGYGRHGRNTWAWTRDEYEKEKTLFTIWLALLSNAGVRTVVCWNPPATKWNPYHDEGTEFVREVCSMLDDGFEMSTPEFDADAIMSVRYSTVKGLL